MGERGDSQGDVFVLDDALDDLDDEGEEVGGNGVDVKGYISSFNLFVAFPGSFGYSCKEKNRFGIGLITVCGDSEIGLDDISSIKEMRM